MSRWRMSDEEFERQYIEATRRGNEALKTEPEARSATYDRVSNRLVIELKNGVVLIVPCDLIQGLSDAHPDEIAEVELMPRGAALHWEKLDQDFSVAGLMRGIYGNKAWMESLQRRNSRANAKAKKRKSG